MYLCINLFFLQFSEGYFVVVIVSALMFRFLSFLYLGLQKTIFSENVTLFINKSTSEINDIDELINGII